MKNKQENKNAAEVNADETLLNEAATSTTDENIDIADVDTQDDENQVEKLEAEILKLKEQVEKEKKEYLFLMAEFDNFRKRTLKEKTELIHNAGEQAFKGLLPILDDFERGIDAACKATDVKSVCEGMELIYSKLKKYLEQNGVKEFAEEDNTFDPDKHEAISAIPVQDENQKGKILDTVQKGYKINDKVLRHAKVVVGQ